MKATDSNFHNRFSNTLEYLGQAKIALDNVIKDFKTKYFIEMEHQIKISVDELKLLNPINFFPHALFANYGFDNVKDLNQLLHAHNLENNCFLKPHRLVKTDLTCCLQSKSEDFNKTYIIEQNIKKIQVPIKLKLGLNNKIKIADKNTACFNIKLLKFPLTL